jgi:hypothetical protein
MSGVRILRGARGFSLFQNVQTDSENQPAYVGAPQQSAATSRQEEALGGYTRDTFNAIITAVP